MLIIFWSFLSSLGECPIRSSLFSTTGQVLQIHTIINHTTIESYVEGLVSYNLLSSLHTHLLGTWHLAGPTVVFVGCLEVCWASQYLWLLSPWTAGQVQWQDSKSRCCPASSAKLWKARKGSSLNAWSGRIGFNGGILQSFKLHKNIPISYDHNKNFQWKICPLGEASNKKTGTRGKLSP